MIEYNLIYAGVWGLALLSMVVGSFWKRYLFGGQVAVLSLFVALKFETGYDWPVYEMHYLLASMGGSFNLRFEVGYELLVLFFSSIGLGFYQFVGLLNIVEMILVASVVRYFFPKYSLLLLAIFYAIPDFYLIPSFSLVRQCLAASLFLYGVRWYVEGRRVVAWLMFGIAVSFHYSVMGALFFGILAFWVKLNKNTLLVFFVLALSLYMFSIDVARLLVTWAVSYIDPKYMIYLERDVYNASLLYRSVYAISSVFAFACIYVVWSRRSFADEKIARLAPSLFRLAMMGVLIPLLVFGFPTISTRYQYFFSVFTVGICLLALELFKPRDRLVIALVACAVAYVPFYRFLVSPLSVVYVPYQSQIFYNKSNSTGQQRTNDLLNQLDTLWSK